MVPDGNLVAFGACYENNDDFDVKLGKTIMFWLG